MKTLKEFLSQIIVESLHPELQQIITAPTYGDARKVLGKKQRR